MARRHLVEEKHQVIKPGNVGDLRLVEIDSGTTLYISGAGELSSPAPPGDSITSLLRGRVPTPGQAGRIPPSGALDKAGTADCVRGFCLIDGVTAQVVAAVIHRESVRRGEADQDECCGEAGNAEDSLHRFSLNR
jgi:hypothetical protein